MHGRASKGSTGLNGGLLLKSDKAIICIDCDQQACTSTARTAAAVAKKTSRRVDDSNVAPRYSIAADVKWCKWRSTCDIKRASQGKELHKQASPTLAAVLFDPRCVDKFRVKARGWRRHRTVAPQL